MTRESILHAVDLALLGDWQGAKECLNSTNDPIAARLVALITRQQELESERAHAQALMRHEVANALAVAQVNVAGMADGVLDVTQQRLNGIRDALQAAGFLLGEQKSKSDWQPAAQPRTEIFDIGEVIAAQVSMLGGLSEAKGVRVSYEPCLLESAACTHYQGDVLRTGQVLRNVLINAVRYTPPGGLIDVSCARADGELTLTVSYTDPGPSVVSKLLRALGEQARIIGETDRGATFIIKLPASAVS